MNNTHRFVENANFYLGKLGSELTELEHRVAIADGRADDWSVRQVAKLKRDWEAARAEAETIAERYRTDEESSVIEAQKSAERHWEALQAAVNACHDHLNKTLTGQPTPTVKREAHPR